MVYTSVNKKKRYILIRKGERENKYDCRSIDSNNRVNDDSTESSDNDSVLHKGNPPEVIEEPIIKNNSLVEDDASSFDSFEEKYVLRKTTSDKHITPHFMMPTETSLQRESLMQEEKQRRSLVLHRESSLLSDKSASKQTKPSTQRNSKPSAHLDQSHLPSFMQPTKAYLCSLQPDPQICPRKSIPAARIREVNLERLPRYMKPTKASINHYPEEQRRNYLKSNQDAQFMPRAFVKRSEQDQPLSSHDEIAIKELRRELERVLSALNSERRISTGKVKCTAIKKRTGDLENEAEVNERVRKEMEKMYPRYMKTTEAYKQNRLCYVCKTKQMILSLI